MSETELFTMRCIRRQVASRLIPAKLAAIVASFPKAPTRADVMGESGCYGEVNGFVLTSGAYVDCWVCGHTGFRSYYGFDEGEGALKVHAGGGVSVIQMYSTLAHLYTEAQVDSALALALEHPIRLTLWRT